MSSDFAGCEAQVARRGASIPPRGRTQSSVFAGELGSLRWHSRAESLPRKDTTPGDDSARRLLDPDKRVLRETLALQ